MILRCICLGVLLSASALAQIRETNRVPPIGIPISADDRGALAARLKEFESELNKIGATPDVRIFHKAVDWALRYDEFYRSNEIAAAHKLIEQGIERAKAVARARTHAQTHHLMQAVPAVPAMLDHGRGCRQQPRVEPVRARAQNAARWCASPVG